MRTDLLGRKAVAITSWVERRRNQRRCPLFKRRAPADIAIEDAWYEAELSKRRMAFGFAHAREDRVNSSGDSNPEDR